MTNRERVLTYLRSISPRAATNREVRDATGIERHHEIYQLTQELMREGLIHGVQRGREWWFWVGEPDSVRLPRPIPRRRGRLKWRQFEALAQRIMSEHYGVRLESGWVGEVHRQFDFLSPDGRIVGDAKYYRRVGGTRWPPVKAATITEHVWLLERTGAPATFLVFGNDRRVPMMWLERYGNLLGDVTFYFLTDEGDLEELPKPQGASYRKV
jgi:hypothetical protein